MWIGVATAFLAGSISGTALAGPVPTQAILVSGATAAGAGFTDPRALEFRFSANEPGHALDQLERPLHRRMLSAMIDYYPSGSSGFHVSGGALRATRGRQGPDVAGLSQSRLVALRRRDVGYRANDRRFAPTMMVGYSLPVGPSCDAGVELGGVMGPVNRMASLPDSALAGNPGMRRPDKSAINGVAHLALGYRF